MTPEETGAILALCASYDARTVGKADVLAWHHAIGDLPYDDARAAVLAHYRDRRDRIMPADVRHRVKTIREERIKALPTPAPDTDDPGEYRTRLRDQLRHAADGLTIPKALDASRRARPGPAYQALRSDDDRDRVLAQSVACPVEWCPARPGEPCRNPTSGLALDAWHPSRLTVAREQRGEQ